jgi:hypothetical protein
MSRRWRWASLSILVLTVALGWSATAQAPAAGSASEFYLQYRVAFDRAATVEDLLPLMSAAMRAQIEATPPAERGQMFGMLKMVGTITDVKILKEARTGNGATLTVEALDPAKAKTIGTIEIVKEGDAWKLGKESWTSAP